MKVAAAKARGKLGGRKPSYRPDQAKVARQVHDAGEHSAEDIGRILGVSRATVYRMLKPAGYVTGSIPQPGSGTRQSREVRQ